MTRHWLVALAIGAAALASPSAWPADPAGSATTAKAGKPAGAGAANPAQVREDTPAAAPQPLTPTEITADTLEYSIAERLITFNGNVHVLDAQCAIAADRMLVTLNDQNEVTRVTATGNVVLDKEETQACGETGDYDVVKGVVVLSGKPVLKHKNPAGQIQGALRVIYDRQAGKFRTEGGQPRAEYHPAAGSKTLQDLLQDQGRQDQQGKPAGHDTPRVTPKAAAPDPPPTPEPPPAATDR